MEVLVKNPTAQITSDDLLNCFKNFDALGKDFVVGQRNRIKIFKVNDEILNIKSFKKPNLFNQVVYRYFRKSKARRSFEYATVLLDKNIGTPEPVAYFEKSDFFGLKKSYYVCRHLEDVFEFRKIVKNADLENREQIIRQFTRFTFEMHQKGIEFLDHSPGNTLIKNNGDGTYSFYLVDLNRMNFHDQMPFELRMKNMSRLTPQKEMIAVMSNEYSRLSNIDEQKIFDTLWKYTSEFQYRYFRKKRIKNKLLFRRK